MHRAYHPARSRTKSAFIMKHIRSDKRCNELPKRSSDPRSVQPLSVSLCVSVCVTVFVIICHIIFHFDAVAVVKSGGYEGMD